MVLNFQFVGRNILTFDANFTYTGSVTKATAVPGTPYFFTGSKDGDVKLWDVSTQSMVGHWPKVHERHTFLQVNTRSLGSIIQASSFIDLTICNCILLGLEIMQVPSCWYKEPCLDSLDCDNHQNPNTFVNQETYATLYATIPAKNVPFSVCSKRQ